jgi:putative transposase
MAEQVLLTQLSEAARAEALGRYRQLQPFLEAGVPLTRLAQAQGVPLRTLRSWLARYRRAGLVGLARQARADRGQRHLPTELQQLIEGLALQRPRPTAALIHRRIRTVAQDRGWPLPSYRTVAAIVQALEPALVTLAQEGTKVYKDRFDLLYRREADRPNEIWQADHTPLDLWVRDERNRPARPWLTVILDDHSRAVAGFSLNLSAPSALQTALTLRQAIWRKGDPRWHICGIPERFYTDHGADFTSQHLEQVAVDLKMVLVFSGVGEPRGRGKIERFFETVHQLCVSALPGYTPAGTAPPATPPLTLPEVEAHLDAFLLDDYHQRIHRETKVAPQARWEAGGFLPRLPDSLEQLDLLLLTVTKPRRVQQDGIHFQGLRYLDLTLAAFVGETVLIRYDPRDLAEIRVYHQERLLCRAVCPELAQQTLSLKDIVRARTERRRELRGQLKERRTLVDRLLEVHQSPAAPPAPPAPAPPAPPAPRLKRYFNE